MASALMAVPTVRSACLATAHRHGCVADDVGLVHHASLLCDQAAAAPASEAAVRHVGLVARGHADLVTEPLPEVHQGHHEEQPHEAEEHNRQVAHSQDPEGEPEGQKACHVDGFSPPDHWAEEGHDARVHVGQASKVPVLERALGAQGGCLVILRHPAPAPEARYQEGRHGAHKPDDQRIEEPRRPWVAASPLQGVARLHDNLGVLHVAPGQLREAVRSERRCPGDTLGVLAPAGDVVEGEGALARQQPADGARPGRRPRDARDLRLLCGLLLCCHLPLLSAAELFYLAAADSHLVLQELLRHGVDRGGARRRHHAQGHDAERAAQEPGGRCRCLLEGIGHRWFGAVA
mmetsp:Transcript_7461/g.23471  ORF Transcript_7461/g.23471 Transcript_7461/m.23471 type:complete len:348 (-) Transcript_7461:39-1082(-)